VITLVFYGTRLDVLEPNFDQKIYWNLVRPVRRQERPCTQTTLNSLAAELAGRWTQPRICELLLKVSRVRGIAMKRIVILLLLALGAALARVLEQR
jgi:hypothetical protein